MSEHTPTPWVAANNEGYSAWTVWSGSHPSGNGPGRMVAEVVGDSAETDANAAFIVKAVNNHEALVKALEFYATGGGLATIEDADRGDIDLADVSEKLTEDCGEVARVALKALVGSPGKP